MAVLQALYIYSIILLGSILHYYGVAFYEAAEINFGAEMC